MNVTFMATVAAIGRLHHSGKVKVLIRHEGSIPFLAAEMFVFEEFVRGWKMIKLAMTVRGQTRNVYLEKQIGPKKWSARTYVGSRSKTTVSGFVTVNSLGARRFTPTGVNASLL